MNKTLLTTACIILVCALAYLVSQNFEYYSEDIDLGWSNEAKINDYLAMQRYLESQDLAVDSIVRLPSEKQLLDADVLIIPTANQIQVESQKRMILKWVENGGTLLIGAGYGDAPPIISDFQFSKKSDIDETSVLQDLILEEDAAADTDKQDENEKTSSENESDSDESDSDESDSDKSDSDKSDSDKGDSDKGDDEEKSLAEQWREHNQKLKDSAAKDQASDEDAKNLCTAAEYHCGKTDEPEIKSENITIAEIPHNASARLHLSAYTMFVHPAFDDGETFVEVNGVSAELQNWFGPERGITYAQVDYGAGEVHIFSRLQFLDNFHIHHFDHAFFMGKLLDGKESLLILFGKDMPSLAQLVYRHFFEALVASIFAIICALFYFGRRLGKVRVLEVNERRSRAERYSAVASFRWQNNDRAALLESAREQVLKKAGRRWPKFSQWPRQEQVRALSKHAELQESAVQSALFDAEDFNEHTFTHMIKVLQALRNCL